MFPRSSDWNFFYLFQAHYQTTPLEESFKRLSYLMLTPGGLSFPVPWQLFDRECSRHRQFAKCGWLSRSLSHGASFFPCSFLVFFFLSFLLFCLLFFWPICYHLEHQLCASQEDLCLMQNLVQFHKNQTHELLACQNEEMHMACLWIAELKQNQHSPQGPVMNSTGSLVLSFSFPCILLTIFIVSYLLFHFDQCCASKAVLIDIQHNFY